MAPDNENQTTAWGRVAVGGLMLLVGTILLVDENVDFLGYGMARLWPLLVVGIGVAGLSSADNERRQRNGLMMVLMGAWMLIASLELWGLDFSNSWPLAVLAVGVANLWRPCRDSRLGGYWLIGSGLIFLCLELNLLGMSWDNAWPLFIILAGGSILWRALRSPRRPTAQGGDHDV